MHTRDVRPEDASADDTDVLGYIPLSDYENTYHRPPKNLITLATSPG